MATSSDDSKARAGLAALAALLQSPTVDPDDVAFLVALAADLGPELLRVRRCLMGQSQRVTLTTVPTEREIRAARIVVIGERRLGRKSDPRMVAVSEWPIEKAADRNGP